MSKLYFLIGISGSGKSSYIKSHFIPEVVVSPDDLRRKFTGNVSNHTQEGKVWSAVPKLLQKSLNQYGKAVLDATNVDSGARAGLLNKFPRDVVERIAVVFNIDPEVAKQRVKADIASGKDRSDVPDDVIDKQYEKFKRGYNSIKQQFDKVIDGNKGRSEMKELYVAPKKLKFADVPHLSQFIADKHKYLKISDDNAYNIDFPKGSKYWRKKPFDPNKIVELIPKEKEEHSMKEEYLRKIVAEEMKNILEQDYDSELEKASYQAYQDMYLTPQSNWRLKKNAPMIDSKGNEYFGKIGEIHKIQTVEYDFLHTGEIVTECGDETYSVDANDFRECFEMINNEEGLKVNNESIIRENTITEEVRKLVKIKNYFGKNIRESIEKLEEVFLGDKFVIKNIMHGKKYYASRVNQYGNIDQWETVSNPLSNDNVLKFTAVEVADILNVRSKWISDKIRIVDEKGKEMKEEEFMREYYGGHGEPEDAYLDQDFEDRISGTDDLY